jgi:putative hydrolase
MHVHSCFSDGAATVDENVERALELGLRRLTCVDHVRTSTDWLPEFVASVDAWRDHPEIEVLCGIEAKMLTIDGDLDLPGETRGVDRIYVADHQMPGPDGPEHPRAVATAIARGERSADETISALVSATANALRGHRDTVIAHLFSILPKLGLSESQVPSALVEGLAETAAATRARLEIDERWSCPSASTAAPFLRRGVEILASTDSHRLDTLGRFGFVRACFQELGLGPDTPAAFARG